MAQLTDFLTSIADVIREKKKTSAPIPAPSFVAEIRGIQGSVKVNVTVNAPPVRETLAPKLPGYPYNHVAAFKCGKFVAIVYNAMSNEDSDDLLPQIALLALDGNNITHTVLPATSFRDMPAVATDTNGVTMIAGGSDFSGIASSTDRYDVNGIRSNGAALSVGRYIFTGAANGVGYILFFGGYDSSNAVRNTVDRYSPTGVRSNGTALSVARAFGAAGKDDGGNTICAGGATEATAHATVDRYSPTGVRSNGTALSVARAGAVALRFPNGNIGVFGGSGYNAPLGIEVAFNTVDVYTPAGVRSTYTSLEMARTFPVGTVDDDGNIIIAGGYAYDVTARQMPLDSIERFNNSNIRRIPIPALNAYKFQEHATEQPAKSIDTIIAVDAPNTGYFAPQNGSITI